jgi:Protein of unknown function (DUF1552)
MIVTRKYLHRRTFLRGVGAAIALPMLDAMVPAFAGPTRGKAPVRLAFAYVPNGMIMQNWTPKGVGKDFEFTRILKPLEPFREDMLVLTGLSHLKGEGVGGDHARASATYLTGVGPGPKPAASSDVEIDISVDQVAAQAIGSQTRLPSLELGLEAAPMVGSCDGGFSCAYMNNMSWRDTKTPVPPETNPRLAFERLYGSFESNSDPKIQAQLKANRKSVLDYVNERTNQLMGTLGPSDRLKIDEYLTAIREIETRIARAESENELTPTTEKPSGIPTSFVDHARLMADLLVVAFQADVTRVATLLFGKEASTRVYPELGFSDSHHPLTHHRNRPELIEKTVKIECHHMEQFAYFVKRLKSIQDGDGTLLDHSMIVYGSAMSEPNGHLHYNLPVLLLGRGDGSIKPGRHVVYPSPKTPMTNLYVTLLDRMGVHIDKLGDSTGKVDQLADV